MDIQYARRVLVRFAQCQKVAEQMQEVLDQTAGFEQRTREAEERYEAVMKVIASWEGERRRLENEVQALRDTAREVKLATERETAQVREHHRVERQRVMQEARAAEEEAKKRVEAALARATEAEEAAVRQEKRAEKAVAEAEARIAEIRKRLGSV